MATLKLSNDSLKSWSCLLPAMFLPFIGAFVYFVLASGTGFAMVLYTMVKMFTLIFPLFAVIIIEHNYPSWKKIAWKQHLKSVPLGILTGSLISGLILGAFYFTPLGIEVGQNSELIRAKVEGLGVLNYYIPFAIFIAVGHSLLEEYFWRWFVFSRLKRRCSIKLAHGLAAMAFALHHYVILSCFFPMWLTLFLGTCVGIGGLMWTLQSEHSKSLLGAWVSHAIIDSVILMIGGVLIFQ